ncbi:MAG: flavin reductase [Oscillospiraceae bacterium]|nr:flavin reductase [Oscillospiraceae bacterium]
MAVWEEKEYKVFELFAKRWALVTAGNMDHFNSCTVGWGSLGTIWGRPGSGGSIVTVYLHPARYTRDVMLESDHFTVSFFPEKYRGALGIMGSRSGRDHDKVDESGLTPVAFGSSVTYEEADLTFLCRKLYQHQLAREDLAADIQDYYRVNPKAYPVDENGDWQPHWLFIGDILDVSEK